MIDKEIINANPRVFSPLWRRSPFSVIIPLFIFSYIIFSLNYFNFSIDDLLNGFSKMKPILLSMVTWSDFLSWNFNSIIIGILQTLSMAFLGTLAASIISIPLGLLASSQVIKMTLPRFIIRRFLDFIRGVDILIWALIFVRAFGLGPLSGVLAIFVADTGTLSKLYSEAADNSDNKQIEGLISSGAKKIPTLRFGLIPQVMPIFISQSLYFFESNSRSAVILGIVGAGGIGLQLSERMKAQYWDQAFFIILIILLMVALIDKLSRVLREKLIND
ncbi:phosphonate ABC transporter, permease protein PhnE [Hyphomicrobiales bacterium]|jgi:phosphonate transport system permease protein|nr:phosphonate ABC transporter, permease protein PhnE [Hyphomicrobiales bacterium]MDG1152481.1 phosphonate ABC transporter, permease protein PhnE [Hyphomicrobiales bacterium]MDG1523380.1 phosphonate ABC transporter, permease protein PhnE [Hyphomicrobiales bacterium]MDG1665420.1 phosphonate ABC transporter, permease protein PhnE [Hyphomicrobiales bacterium]MDG2413856.1 phosphonate ABC transporter, permease protein PhnE [Hyphomicrobiales bacterium]|tara:strand:+ start:232 stop:1056 length:825 start_codon:yes stop_codon:yes gene_type:complete